MSKNNDGGPAFPYSPVTDSEGHIGAGQYVPELGMSLRDYFAGQALSSIADHFSVSADRERTKASQLVVARLCYDYADAMIEAREPTNAD